LDETQDSALAGLRVLELGQLIAGPFATSVLASFGADVVKVEEPTRGDPIRKWRMLHDETSLWWRSLARNKRSLCLDLRSEEGQETVRRFVREAGVDVVVENFRPGRLEQWGIGYEQLRAINPRLIMVRVSGWGQDGPRAQEPGFANIAEAVGGLRYLSGEPGRPPVRSGVSIGDSLAGLHAALGLLLAIYHRDVAGSGVGQVVDVALHESVFHMLESTLPEYDFFGKVRERSGAAMPGIVPTNTYPCLEGRWIAIGANSDAMYRRLMRAIGREDLAQDPALAQNDGRVAQATRIDAAIVGFTETRSVEEVLGLLRAAEVAVGGINSIEDIARDEQYLAREMFEEHELPDGRRVKVAAARPALSLTPAFTRWLGPELGAHTREVLEDWLGENAEG
jgi:formyl-CoA transferase